MIPNRISDLSSAPYKSFIFLAGMQLDVFSTLSENQTTAKQLADIMNLKENHIERLLYGLVSIGLLKQEKNKFMNGNWGIHCGLDEVW
jgi:predicted transcriptional regulator